MLQLARVKRTYITGAAIAFALLFVFIFMNPARQIPATPMPVSQVTVSTALKAGELAPDFSLTDHNGDTFTLTEALENGPVVMTFFRGNWCPICAAQLRKLDMQREKIEALGGQIVAISAQLPKDTAETQKRFSIEMPVLSDTGMAVTKLYGVEWQMPDDVREKTTAYVEEAEGRTLSEINGGTGLTLPVPATYVIDQNGVIAYAFVNVDYRVRADEEKIFQALKAISY